MIARPIAMTEDERTPDELSFEEAMESLDTIVNSLEGERLPLEEMVTGYERGMKLLRVCRARIETARKRVEMITADLEGKGKATLSDFAPMESSEPAATDESPKPKAPKKKPAPAEEAADDGEIRLF